MAQVFVTGGSGFIGHVLVRRVLDEGNSVRALGWIDGGRHTTDVTFVDNAVEGLMLGWRSGRPGQAYFITDRHRVHMRDFLETLFEIYGVDEPIADVDAETAAREVPLPARWFLGQPCILSDRQGCSRARIQADRVTCRWPGSCAERAGRQLTSGLDRHLVRWGCVP